MYYYACELSRMWQKWQGKVETSPCYFAIDEITRRTKEKYEIASPLTRYLAQHKFE